MDRRSFSVALGGLLLAVSQWGGLSRSEIVAPAQAPQVLQSEAELLAALQSRPQDKPTAAQLKPLGLRVMPDRRNQVASRLEGTWVPDPKWSDDLGTKPQATMVFRVDPEIASKVPQLYERLFSQAPIFESGLKRTIFPDGSKQVQPYVLTSLAGGMRLVSFSMRDKSPYGDAEMASICLAGGKGDRRDRDRLLLGGDTIADPWKVWKRQ